MLPDGTRTTAIFTCLDGELLYPGDRVEVISDYPDSEVAHYDGLVGHVLECDLDYNRMPVVYVHLEGVPGKVILRPSELMHEDHGDNGSFIPID